MTATAIIQNGFIPTFGMCKKFFDHLLAQCIYLCAKDAGVMFRPKNEPALRIFVSPRDSILAGSLLHLITSSAIARFYRGYIKCVFDVWRNPDSNFSITPHHDDRSANAVLNGLSRTYERVRLPYLSKPNAGGEAAQFFSSARAEIACRQTLSFF